MRKFTPRLKRIGTEDAFSVMAKANKFEQEELAPKGEKLIRLQIGEPAFDTPQNIKDAAIKAINDNQTHYTPPPGMPKVRQAIADYSTKMTGTKYEMDDVVVHAGAKPCIFYTLNATIDEGDEVIIFDPAWPIYASVTNYLGGKPVFVGLKEELGFQPDIEEVKKAITDKTVAMVVNTPSNPTGGVFDEKTLNELAKLAVEHDFWVISDEIYDNIVFEGKHISITLMPGMAERTVLLNGASKTFAMTGWRMGWSVTKNKEMKAAIEQIQINDVSCPAAINQLAVLEAVSSPKSFEDVEKMRQGYLARRDLITKLVNEIPGFSAAAPKGTFYLFANVKPLLEKLGGITVKELADKIMREAKVLLLHGSGFGPHGEGFIRFSFVSSEADIQEGCRRIKDWTEKIME
jgi:aspartate/methionine/tyrosine aminotransferase